MHWRESPLDRIKKLENLEKDCLNAPYHYFGDHKNCAQYFCQKKTTKESIRTIKTLKSSGLFHELLNYCNSYFANNVTSILENETTNAAEELNNVIAKYLGNTSTVNSTTHNLYTCFNNRRKEDQLFLGWFIHSQSLRSCRTI